MHFLQPAEKQKKYAFSHGKMHISEKSWSHQKCILKMHIFCVLSKTQNENAYFLRAIFTAVQKCNGSGRPTFLICTVSPKAVLWRFFSACFSLRHLNVTQQVWQQILIPALQSQLEPSVPYSGTLKDMDLHGLSSIQT